MKWVLAVLGAVLCCALVAVTWTLTLWDRPADAMIVAAVDEGLQLGQDRDAPGLGVRQAFHARLAAWGWERGGFEGAVRGSALAELLFIGFLTLLGWVVLIVALWFLPARLFGWVVAAGIAVSAGLAAWGWTVRAADAGDRVGEERLYLPHALAGILEEKHEPVYLNPSAFPALELLGVRAEGRHDTEYILAAGDPTRWRALDRRDRFGSVALIGHPAEYRPLLDHLLESTDWRIGYLDNHGVVFVRDPGMRWTPPSAADWEREFPDAVERAVFLSQWALKLAAVKRHAEARRALRDAVELAPDRPEVLARFAGFEAERGRWGDALKLCEQALVLRPDYPPALQVKIQALLELRRPDAAWAEARRLAAAAPGDPYALFLFAKSANAARAFASEADALERLLALSRRRGLPDISYRLYLGQAYARQGLAAAAAEQFRAVLDSGALGGEQERQVREMLETIESH